MKTIFIGTYYQVKTFLRIKKALFFSFIFPPFIYIIFSQIWGPSNPEYQKFLLTGIIILTVTSDSLFSVGNVIVEYYQSGLIKFFKVIPYNFNYHLISLFFSRVLIIFLSTLTLLLIAHIINHLTLTLSELIDVALGMISGIFIFSLLGIIVAHYTKENTQNLSLTNLLFFSLIFLSDTFYPLSELNPAFVKIISINPITAILKISRGTPDLISLLIWVIFLFVVHSFFFIKKKQ